MADAEAVIADTVDARRRTEPLDPEQEAAIQKELDFTIQKTADRRAEAAAHGCLLPCETTPADTAAAVRCRLKRLREAQLREHRLQAGVLRIEGRRKPFPATFWLGKTTFVTAEACDGQLPRTGLDEIMEAADVLVVRNPCDAAAARCSHRFRWVAVLRGAWVVSPAVAAGQHGTVLKFRPAISASRKVCLSLAFRAKYPGIVSCIYNCLREGPVLEHGVGPVGSKWKIVGEEGVDKKTVALALPAELGTEPFKSARSFCPKTFFSSRCVELDHASCFLNVER